MKVGVIGSGAIGPDLAYGFLSALSRDPNAKVYLVDIKQDALDQGVKRIRGYMGKGMSRGKISPKLAKAMEAALVPTTKIGDLADCEYVLEAASEDLNIKRKILADIEKTVNAECLIGFATSGLPRAQIAAEAKHPGRCFVNHPFFPAWRALPIEVVLSGDAKAGARMTAMLRQLEKVPVVTSDVECFAADDIFCNYIAEAARIVEEGIATPAQVDKVVNDAVGGGGPFNVMDGTRGNLLTVHCQELMRTAKTGSEWFRAPKILTTQGNQAWHNPAKPGDPNIDPAVGKIVLDRVLAVLFARTYFVADNGICTPTELNWLTRTALGFRTGLLELAAEYGAQRVNELCGNYAAKHPGFEVPKSITSRDLKPFYRNLQVLRDGDVGVVSIFRPEVKNALSAQTIQEIGQAFDELNADAKVRGIVFTSTDGALAGADIQGLAALPTPAACREICLSAHPLLAKISGSKKPVVAAVNGPVLGGGAEISMACHARVVGQGLMLGQPEVNLGIIPGYGGTQRLPRLIGLERAAVMLRTARTANAKEACEWGWAYGEPVQDVLQGAMDLVRQHLAGAVKLAPVDPSPMTVTAIPPADIGHRSLAIDGILVDVMKRGLAMPLDKGLALEADGFGRCKETVDMDIGMKNFTQNGPRVPAAFLHE